MIVVKVFRCCRKTLRCTRVPITNTCHSTRLERTFVTEVQSTEETKAKEIHPYRNIHPWKSLEEFSQSLIDTMIYNADGLVVLNKPYAIPRSPWKVSNETASKTNAHKVPNAVEYSIEDALPYIKEKLGYKDLIFTVSAKKYTTGITILATDEKGHKAVKKSAYLANLRKDLSNTFWILTAPSVQSPKGKDRLGITIKQNQEGKKRPVLLKEYGQNALKRGEIRTIDVQYQVLSNSTLNLCSLIKVKIHHESWNSLRLYASTMLHAPVLGDNMFGSRIKKIMGAWVKIDPFLPMADDPPKLDPTLLKFLRVPPAKQHIIPVHVHLRSVFLPSLFRRGNDVTFEAPLAPYYKWTCDQLMLKYLAQENPVQNILVSECSSSENVDARQIEENMRHVVQ